jgi:hypothetical protein
MFSDVEFYRMDRAGADHCRSGVERQVDWRGFTRGDNGVIEMIFPLTKTINRARVVD